MQALIEYIRNFVDLPDSEVTAFTSKLRKLKLDKGEFLVSQGKVCNELCFVVSGALRSYYLKEGKDITISFTFANDFITSVYSFVSRKPAYESIEAMENSVLYSISYENLQELFKKHPLIEHLYRIILEQYYIKMEERIIFSKFKTAKERYLDLLENRTEIIQKASVGQIASYLDVSIETLSRIRSKG
jgi:CRP-like cAMP-binding protein